MWLCTRDCGRLLMRGGVQTMNHDSECYVAVEPDFDALNKRFGGVAARLNCPSEIVIHHLQKEE